jgi:hypothetical protein
MSSLFLKTIMRVLIVFLPVISLSLAKDTYAQQPENILILGIGTMLILGIILVFIWRDRRTRIARNQKSRHVTYIPRTAKKPH